MESATEPRGPRRLRSSATASPLMNSREILLRASAGSQKPPERQGRLEQSAAATSLDMPSMSSALAADSGARHRSKKRHRSSSKGKSSVSVDHHAGTRKHPSPYDDKPRHYSSRRSHTRSSSSLYRVFSLLFVILLGVSAAFYAYKKRERSQQQLTSTDVSNEQRGTSLATEDVKASAEVEIRMLTGTLQQLEQRLSTVESALEAQDSRAGISPSEISGIVRDLSQSSFNELSDVRQTVEKIQVKLGNLEQDLTTKTHERMPSPSSAEESLPVDVAREHLSAISNLEKEMALLKKDFYLDSVGQVDWAQYSMGGRIIKSDTSVGFNDRPLLLLYTKVAAFFSLDRYKGAIPRLNAPPEVLLGGKDGSDRKAQSAGFAGPKGSVKAAGNCYAVAPVANVTIVLERPVLMTGVSIDHILPELSPEGGREAPKTFKVIGAQNVPVVVTNAPAEVKFNADIQLPLADLEEVAPTWRRKEVHYGTFSFDYPPNGVQHFQVPRASFSGNSNLHVGVKRVKFAFESNYGSPFTCLYRLRIHGVPVDLNEGGHYEVTEESS